MKIKNLLSFILFMFCISMQARQYTRIKGSCRLELSEQDMFNEEKTLPFKLKSHYILAFEKKTMKLLGYKMILIEDVNVTSPYDREILQSLSRSFSFKASSNQRLELSYRLELSRKQIKTLLLYSGSYRAGHYDHEFGSVKTPFVKNSQILRQQLHLPVDEDYGASYHLKVRCSTDLENTSNDDLIRRIYGNNTRRKNHCRNGMMRVFNSKKRYRCIKITTPTFRSHKKKTEFCSDGVILNFGGRGKECVYF